MGKTTVKSAGVAAVALATFALTGCASAASSDSSDSSSDLPALLQSAVDSGVFTVGTSVNAPIAYVETGSGDFAGITADIMREYLDRKGVADQVELTVETMDFASLIPALQSNRIEYIIDTMYVTEERDKVVDFTDTLFFNPEALVVPSGNPDDLSTLADLCGKAAGSYEGSAYLDLLAAASAACESSPIDIKTYPKIDDVINDIAAGRLDAGVIDATVTAYGISTNPDLGVELAADYVPDDIEATAASNALLPGNEDFIEDFNTELAAMKDDGTLAEILDKNGLSPAEYFLQQ